MNSSAQRILTGLVGAPLVFALAWYGGWPFAVLVGIAAIVAQYEFYCLAGLDRFASTMTLGLLAGAVVVLRTQLGPPTEFAFLAVAILLLASLILLHGRANVLLLGSASLAGVIYPTMLLSYMEVMRSADALPGVARQLTVLTLLGVWTADTVAYAVGRRFGKHHMSEVSSAKTWEGFYGGLVGAVVVVAAVAAIIGPLGAVETLFVGLASGIIGPLGDLTESVFKRSAVVKDSGRILPGHGGMLDRLDALIVVAPVVYGWATLTGLL